ncbi:MAG: radical SAM protein, partial [Leptospiraceae bacterium]|nr:radical SAM protein [Leptospiraceae bacterium]
MKTKLWRITIDTNPEDCNLHCIMCEEHSQYSNYKEELYRTTGVKRRVMPPEWLENIFSQGKELGVHEVIPSTMGEPLLYKSFDRILDYCNKSNIKLNLTTNGTFPRRKVEDWAELICPITSDIKISWNGASKETAESIMVGQDFNKALNKLKTFITVRDNIFKDTGNFCRVTLQLTFLKNNMH